MAKSKVKTFGATPSGLLVLGLVIGLVAGYGIRSLQSSSAAPKPKTSASLGTCVVSPSPVKAGQVFAVTGQNIPGGYNGGYWISLHKSTTTGSISAGTLNSDGSVGPVQDSDWNAGTDTFQVLGRKLTNGSYTDTIVSSTCNVSVQ